MYSRARAAYELLAVECPGEPLAPSDLAPLCRGHGVDMQVYGLRAHTAPPGCAMALQLLAEERTGGKHTCQLLLHAEHYHLILNPVLTRYAKCATCGKWRSNPAEHVARCKMCGRCGLTFT